MVVRNVAGTGLFREPWRDEGDMRRRWCAAGLLEAERKFRRLRGRRQMPDLLAALTRHTRTITPTYDTDNTAAA